MAKLLSFSDESRSALERGVDALADAVRVTIGPRGRNVVLEKSFGAPDIVNDGDTIAKEIELEDPFENLGAKLIQQVASKTKDKAGDGTTTATVLAQAMVREGLRNTAAGASPVELRRGMEKACAEVVKGLSQRSQSVEADAIRQVATVSAGGDDEVGRMVAEAMDRVSVDGVITVEESKSLATELEVTEGMAFDRGYSSPYFVTDGDRQLCEFDNLLLLFDHKVSSVADLVPVLETVQQSDPPGDPGRGSGRRGLATLVVNKNRGVLRVAAVRRRSANDVGNVADIAILTDGTVISEDRDEPRQGHTRRFDAPADHHQQGLRSWPAKTTRPPWLTGWPPFVANWRTPMEYDREALTERIAKLAGGVAVSSARPRKRS